MQRVQTYSPASQVESAALNAIQDQALASHQAGGLWLGRRPVLASTGGTNLTVGASGGCCIGSVASPADGVVLPGTPSTITLAGLGANAWYYVYAYNSGSASSPALAIEYSTTAPYASNMNVKDSTALRAYIGCFRTDATSNVIPFRMVEGEYLYRWSKLAGGRDDVKMLDAGTQATTWADVPLTTRVPPHVYLAYLIPKVNGAAGKWAQVRTKGDTSDALDLPSIIASTNHTLGWPFWIETDSSQVVQYRVGDTTHDATDLTLYAMGFRE